MSARALAQEASGWYVSHLDPAASHADNVRNYLRRPVLALTRKILISDTAGTLSESLCSLEIETDAPVRAQQNGVNNWRTFLHRASSSLDDDSSEWNKKDEELYEALERRTKARMEAFLAGCALAVPDDPLNAPQRKPTKTPTNRLRLPTMPRKQPTQNGDRNDLSLTEALSGYNVADKPKSGSGTASPTLAAIQPATDILRQLSNGSTGSKVAFPQIREAELATRLELYIRSLTRVRASKKECVVAMEPPRAVKARVQAVVVAFIQTVGCVRSMSPVLTTLLQALTKELLAVDSLGGDVCDVMQKLVSEYEKQTSFASLAFLSSPEDAAEKTLTPLLLAFVEYLKLNWENLVSECDLERMLETVLDGRMRHLFKTIEFQSIGHLLEVCHGFREELQQIQLPPDLGGIQKGDVTTRCMDPDAIRQAVRDMQRETITVNGHTLPPVRNRKELVTLLSETLNSRTLMHGKRKSSKVKRKKVSRTASCPVTMMKPIDQDTDDLISSGNEGDTDGSLPSRSDVPGEVVPTNGKRRSSRRSFHLKTVDMMTRRLLIASSRTGMGGDAFFIVKDLFGDDDVEVVASKSLPSYGRVARGGTIEIVVRLTSVTIKCHGSFDVYPKPLERFQEPLIQVHTTTSETIYLQEVRAGDSSSDDLSNNMGYSSDDSDSSPAKSVLVLQERKTEKTGWRTLSIRPALYEVVEEWNTPS